MEKFEPEPEKKLELDINLEVSPEDLEKYKGFKDEIESHLMGLELTEEEIEQGFVPVDLVSLEPIIFIGEEVPDFDDPEEEAKAKKVAWKFAFELLGFDHKNAKLIKEKPGQEKDTGKEYVEQYFETNNPNLVLIYNGVDFWVTKREAAE